MLPNLIDMSIGIPIPHEDRYAKLWGGLRAINMAQTCQTCQQKDRYVKIFKKNAVLRTDMGGPGHVRHMSHMFDISNMDLVKI